MTEQALQRQRAQTEADLLSAGYDRATAAMLADAASQNQANQFNAQAQEAANNRGLSAAGLLGQFGTSTGEQQRADVGAQLNAGQTQQQLDQAKLNALPTFLSQIGSLYGYIPTGAFTSTNTSGTGTSQGTMTTKTSDPMGTLGQLAGIAATAMTGIPMFGAGAGA
jgi:hypothetical protein